MRQSFALHSLFVVVDCFVGLLVITLEHDTLKNHLLEHLLLSALIKIGMKEVQSVNVPYVSHASFLAFIIDMD
jgi:hypothetical protein